ncbi:Uncharacterised protein [Serratia grimesii]|uniref:hypothetical protein n=1 Tax=Serratia grimesii TaxID=82995 RepID=UPI00217AFC67|nr:hypothetical protein [Serratia grimesii]CAI1502083.1 Uncharacterised protein [Serratia grimesii]
MTQTLTTEAMERESRYLVIQFKDASAALTAEQRRTLADIADAITAYRLGSDKQPLEAVVVEADWPEYEQVWNMIETRVKEGEKSLIVWSEPMGDAVVPLFTVATAQASGVVNLPTEFISDEGVVVRLEQVMAALALVGVKYERRGGACRAAMLKAESKPCNRCHGEEWVIDEMGITPCICRRDGNATLTNEDTIAQPQNEPQIIPNNIPDGCEWIYDAQDCKWDSGCGDAWMFCDGGPAENGVKFCQCCGKPVVLAAAPEGGNG